MSATDWPRRVAILGSGTMGAGFAQLGAVPWDQAEVLALEHAVEATVDGELQAVQ